MGKVLAGLTYKDCLVYMDEVLVFSNNVDDHFGKLERVFQRSQDHGLTVNPRKTRLLRTSVTYLGHEISTEGIRPDPRLVETVAKCRTP